MAWLLLTAGILLVTGATCLWVLTALAVAALWRRVPMVDFAALRTVRQLALSGLAASGAVAGLAAVSWDELYGHPSVAISTVTAAVIIGGALAIPWAFVAWLDFRDDLPRPEHDDADL